MATPYDEALQAASSLTLAERLRLIHQLRKELQEPAEPAVKKTRSILELRGLGAELWKGIDAQEYINEERASWDREWDR